MASCLEHHCHVCGAKVYHAQGEIPPPCKCPEIQAFWNATIPSDPTDPIVLEGIPYVHREDGGSSLQLEITSDETEVFVRLLSDDDDGKHEDLELMIGKRLRVTIEALEED